jgi:hypothetical protein
MTGWYYIKKGIFDDTIEGPLDNAGIARLAFDGKLKSSAKVMHEQHTQGGWVEVSRVPGLLAKIEEGKQSRVAHAESQKQEKQAARQAAREEAQQRKQEREEYRQQGQAPTASPPPPPPPVKLDAAEPTVPAQKPDETAKRLLGLIGGGLLVVGVFCPFIRAPFMGSVDYFRGGTGDGVIVLVLGAIAVCLTILRLYIGNLLPGLASLGMLAFTFVSFQQRLAESRAQLDAELAGNPFRSIGDAMVRGVTIDWGFVMLVVAAVLTIASALVPARQPVQVVVVPQRREEG